MKNGKGGRGWRGRFLKIWENDGRSEVDLGNE